MSEDRFVTKAHGRVTEGDSDFQQFDMKLKEEGAPDAKTGVGSIYYEKDFKSNEYIIRKSRVDQEYRGKGVGAGMYRQLFEQAKKEGFKVRSDSGMSPQSIAIWRRFQELGYPIKEHPHGRVPGRQYEMRTDKRGTEDAPLFEYDPLEGAEITPQAGQVPDDTTPATGALLKPQAGEARTAKKGEIEPGIYLDDTTGEYWQVGPDGQIGPVEVRSDGTN
jgi:GNAT superfamily N-acetyltransferase